MKKQLKKRAWIFKGLIAILFLHSFSIGQKLVDRNDSIILRIAVVKKSKLRINSICATVSTKKQKLVMPSSESVQFGYPNDSASDFTFELVEIRKFQDSILIPTSDYQNLGINKKFIELNYSDSITYFFPIDMFFQIKKRKNYKLRLKLNLSKWNNKSDIYSNWLFFSR